MPLFCFRMKDGNSVIIYAPDQRDAEKYLAEMGLQNTAASVRLLNRFVASFALSDAGDLHTTLLDPGTLHEVSRDYPLLQAARDHSYADFGASSAGDPSAPELFDDSVNQDAHNWNRRDKDLIAYVVQKERERLSN
jgi:hypothetical protein